MYLWNTRALASQLRSGDLSQAERFKYFFLLTILMIFATEFHPYIVWLKPSIPSLIESLLSIGVTVVGTYWSYTVNKAGDGQEFIDRYICLSLPITIRLTVAFFGIMFVCDVISYLAYGKKYEELSAWIDVVLSTGFAATIYWRLIYYIKMVAQN